MGAIREDKKVPFDWKKKESFKNLLTFIYNNTTRPHDCKIWKIIFVDTINLVVTAFEGEMLSQQNRKYNFFPCQLPVENVKYLLFEKFCRREECLNLFTFLKINHLNIFHLHFLFFQVFLLSE